ncbi:hypothetical protein [Kibdelosporangium aridum]|uniref:hypothetical protein n=1 Tax=Kibdelosporangium aridum TaxID=2030 RepID=UPI0035E7C14E
MKAETLVAEIARVTGWQGNGKALPDWASVEGELGTPLPTDYKGLLSPVSFGNVP